VVKDKSLYQKGQKYGFENTKAYVLYRDGHTWLPKKTPKTVQGHDFPEPSVPKALPYGIYDIALNQGFVNIGTDHDTGAFAVASIRGWWFTQGQYDYPAISKLLITADGGGSNGSRLRAWKFELQKLAEDIAIPIQNFSFPPRYKQVE
jgi:hypothetical protein